MAFQIELSEAERSALVAAIRWWQITSPDDFVTDIANRDGEIESLDNQKLSELAGRILPGGPR